MSGTDMLVSAINAAMPRAGAISPTVGIVSSVGGPPNQMVAQLDGVFAGSMDVPQRWFSSWFLSEVLAAMPLRLGGLNGARVLVIFTDGGQPVILSTLAIGA